MWAPLSVKKEAVRLTPKRGQPDGPQITIFRTYFYRLVLPMEASVRPFSGPRLKSTAWTFFGVAKFGPQRVSIQEWLHPGVAPLLENSSVQENSRKMAPSKPTSSGTSQGELLHPGEFKENSSIQEWPGKEVFDQANRTRNTGDQAKGRPKFSLPIHLQPQIQLTDSP